MANISVVIRKAPLPLLGCIADDFTGGTDLANNLVKSGFRTVQTIGIPKSSAQLTGVDAVVVALKTRTCPPEQAISESSNALHWLESLGCRQFYFKYCSTFDSTPRGNIGPVIRCFCENWEKHDHCLSGVSDNGPPLPRVSLRS
jgi:uncharacterized protein YgbK (DUF1537 family)